MAQRISKLACNRPSVLLVFLLSMAAALAVYASLAGGLGSSASVAWLLSFTVTVVWWAGAERIQREGDIALDYSAWFLSHWYLLLPCYLWQTRGFFKGTLMNVLFFGALLGPYLSG